MMKNRPLILQRLRDETMSSHTQIEGESIMVDLAKANVSIDQYKAILLMWHAMFSDVFTQASTFISTDTSPIVWLEKDLSHLSCEPNQTSLLGAKINSREEAIGFLYVFYGSQLGNKVIHHRLCESERCASWPKNYFFGHGKDTAKTWSQFGTQLASQTFCTSEINTAVRAAITAFELVRRNSARIA